MSNVFPAILSLAIALISNMVRQHSRGSVIILAEEEIL